MNWTDILEKLRKYRKYDQSGLVITWHGERRFYYAREWCCADTPLTVHAPQQNLDTVTPAPELRRRGAVGSV